MSARVAAAWSAAVLTVAGLGGLLWRLWANGYLPQPLYFRPDDSLMDLYTTAFWANAGGAYERWHSLYPPLSFAFLKVFSLHHCYGIDALHARARLAAPWPPSAPSTFSIRAWCSAACVWSTGGPPRRGQWSSPSACPCFTPSSGATS